MQFKHPEILWALLLLLIPIIIHLFQLRKFKKTPFTNVAMLQKVVAESRKSNSLKKWLLLFSRLLLLTALILAFAQPFTANNTALKEKETVIYLDDSFSMQAKKDGLTLLEKAVQDLVIAVPENNKFSLFTNKRTFKNVELKAIQNSLLGLSHTSKQLTIKEIQLKANTLFSNSTSTVKNLILISDLQRTPGNDMEIDSGQVRLHLVKMAPDDSKNLAIDSVYIGDSKDSRTELKVLVSGLEKDESVPISLYNDDKLIAKSAAISSGNEKTESVFSLPTNTAIKGRLAISDTGLDYDNHFYFNIDDKEKIKVLTISGGNSNFLARIFTKDEFIFEKIALRNLNYSSIESQNLIVLDNVTAIPNSLQTVLQSFHSDGGNLIVIPAIASDISSYNSFLGIFFNINLKEYNDTEQDISKISFEHPLFSNVFEKKVVNFDFPKVKQYIELATSALSILSFRNDAPFLVGRNRVFFFTAPLETENSNFENSPLIVPTFYNIGLQSLKAADLFLTTGRTATVDIGTDLERDNILKLKAARDEFIPLQQSYANKVQLTFNENPKYDGIYSVVNGNDTLQNMSFNYDRDESKLHYIAAENVPATSVRDSIPALFESLSQNNAISHYWKWFVIFALVFALVELLIQKFLA